MSTTRLTIYDLLRITYTYESQALLAGASAQPPRRSSASSVCSTPETCLMLSASPPASGAAAEALETDFTERYRRASSASAGYEAKGL